jgi:hypothetical protein
MKARVEPSACNQKSRNTGCCPLLSLQPVLENVKGVKRKGRPCVLEVFNVDFVRSAERLRGQKSSDTVVGRRESALTSSQPPHPSSKSQHNNNQKTKRPPCIICV